MKINKQGLGNLPETKKRTLQNFGKKAVTLTASSALALSLLLAPATPVMAKDYAYVPYNAEWGNKEVDHEIEIRISASGLGVVDKEEANAELLEAIYDCLGKKKVQNSKYNLITFKLVYAYPNATPSIDKNSFEFYRKRLSSLRPFTRAKATLRVNVFMSPEGQIWVDEDTYRDYADDNLIIYQCSDGTLAHSYEEYRDWEAELAYHPHGPNYPFYPECAKTLAEVGYTELGSNGTVWRDQAMLEEYLTWREFPTARMKDGLYMGNLGTAISFEEYARIYNAGYFVGSGVKKSELYYGAYGFLYSSPEKAMASMDALNSYQKSIQK